MKYRIKSKIVKSKSLIDNHPIQGKHIKKWKEKKKYLSLSDDLIFNF